MLLGAIGFDAPGLSAAWRKGLLFLDSEGYLDVDYVAFDNLAAKLNPSVQWWFE